MYQFYITDISVGHHCGKHSSTFQRILAIMIVLKRTYIEVLSLKRKSLNPLKLSAWLFAVSLVMRLVRETHSVLNS